MQRIAALNAFLDDIYGEQKILRDGMVPAELVLGGQGYEPKLRGIAAPGGVRIPIAGIDLIRSPDGVFRVLEDNVRTPSGVSYVVENRLVTKRMFRDAIELARVRRVEQYPMRARRRRCARSRRTRPKMSTWSCSRPGIYNSAYFEHSFLARHMGIDLVRAGGPVRRRRHGLRAHHARAKPRARHLPPHRRRLSRSRSSSAPTAARRARPDARVRGGRVSLVNAPGNGVADDKAVYPFVPDMIRYYLGEEPILAQVDTYVCAREDDKQYVLEHLDELVVKAVDEAGGYGMLMGPQSTAARARRVPHAHRGRAAQVHRAASHRALDLPDVGSAKRRSSRRAASICGRSS